jgi:amidase
VSNTAHFSSSLCFSNTRLPSSYYISGYTGVYANGDGDKGIAECPFEFYNTWVKNPKEAQRMSEQVTRSTIGVSCCPVAGIPAPQDEKDIEELTHELNLE